MLVSEQHCRFPIRFVSSFVTTLFGSSGTKEPLTEIRRSVWLPR